MRRIGLLVSVIPLALLVGCGASALPVGQMAPPREEIRAAEESGAEKNPRAALHLKYAKDQVAEADRFLKNGDEQQAQLSLMRANADAKLSLELVREEKARTEVEEVQLKIQQLQKTTTSSP